MRRNPIVLGLMYGVAIAAIAQMVGYSFAVVVVTVVLAGLMLTLTEFRRVSS